MAKNAYWANILTGGATGALDKIDGVSLADLELAFVATATMLYPYSLDADDGGAESSPDKIQPDTNAGTKMWDLLGLTIKDLALQSITDAGVDTNKFLVLDASNNVDYRTGAEMLADLSGDAAADFSMNTHKITNVVNPAANQDVATKLYVDSVASGLEIKDPVRVATIAALPANTATGHETGKTLTADAVGILAVDGVNTVLNDRILVKNQSSADDGIYKVTTAGTAGVAFVLTRATDADTDAEVNSGMYCFVTEGSTLIGTAWVMDGDCEVDVATPSFIQFSAATSFVEDDAYGAGWNGDTAHAPSQNAVYDIFNAHKDRHDPNDGADPLDCAAAAEIVGVQSAAEGSAHLFARSDHAHQIQHGITDNHLVTIDGTTNANEYARFTANGIVGRTEAEFKVDFNLEIGTDVLAQQTIGIANNNLVKTDHASIADNDYAKFTASGLEGRNYAEILADLSGQVAAAFDFNSQNLTSIKQMDFNAIVGDKISLVGDRLGLTTMYGFGIEADCLYFKSNSFHRWYSAANANGGTSDIMELDSNGNLNLPNHNASTIGLKLGGTLITKSAAEINAAIGDVTKAMLSPIIVPAAAFVPSNDQYDWTLGNGWLQNRTTLTVQYFRAGVYIPDGVIVSKVTLVGYRDDASSVMAVYLKRADASNISANMAAFAADWTSGHSSGYDDSIDNATIDNDTYSYFVLLALDPNDSVNDIWFRHVQIDFS
ncbi:MAG: hypothetical protein KAX30_04300 [Candidatus Atribacteria bacterium]|nr:hypothetical protein [Candidatus Atribacteria bacterium]